MDIIPFVKEFFKFETPMTQTFWRVIYVMSEPNEFASIRRQFER
jgi:hypothetical protein